MTDPGRMPGHGEPMRLVYVWDADYPWDVRTEKVCAALTAAGHDVHIVARNRAGAALRDVRPEGTVHRMPPARSLGRRLDDMSGFPAFFNPRWVAHLDRTVREVEPSVIVVRDLPLCPTAIRAGRRAGVPVVLDMAENYPAMIRDIWTSRRARPLDVFVRNPFLVSLVERYCIPRVDHTVVVVEESRDRLLREFGVPEERVTVVSNTPPRSRAEAVPPERSDTRAVDLVYLGLMEVPRGVEELIDAVAILRDEGHAVTATLVGDGRDMDLFRERRRRRGLDGDTLRLEGRLPHDRALAAVARADIGIVPHHANESWNTTIPNKLFDYMAAGLPVVSSDAEPCVRVLEETGAGHVFRSRSAESLADAVRRLLDPADRKDCGDSGRRTVLERYNWENDSARLVDVVEGLRAPSHPGAASR